MENLQCLKHFLIEKNLSLSTCESLTGGMLSSTICSLEGASKFFKGSIVAYSSELKINLIHVPENIIVEKGAVSYETAEYLAKNCAKSLNTNISISTTGVAGPDSLEGKEVGTVFIGIYYSDETKVCEYRFMGDRESIREQTTKKAISFLLEELNKSS
mgnify:FL=1